MPMKPRHRLPGGLATAGGAGGLARCAALIQMKAPAAPMAAAAGSNSEAFLRAHGARPDKLFQQMADRALDYVMNRFWDAQSWRRVLAIG